MKAIDINQVSLPYVRNLGYIEDADNIRLDNITGFQSIISRTNTETKNIPVAKFGIIKTFLIAPSQGRQEFYPINSPNLVFLRQSTDPYVWEPWIELKSV